MAENNVSQQLEYLAKRKDFYKIEAARNLARMQIFEKRWEQVKIELAIKKKEFRALKANYRKELIMKKWWKFSCYLCGTALVVTLLSAAAISQFYSAYSSPYQSVPTGNDQESPNYVLAAVNIYNGKLQGSGVVISVGEKKAAILSAAHNFRGNIGGWCWVYFPDGTYTKGILKVIDKQKDLALVEVPSDSIIARAYIPQSLKGLQGKLCGVGYKGGQGPNLRTLSYLDTYQTSRQMWALKVVSGPFGEGDSGSGVFMGNALVGITQEGPVNSWKRELYACTHSEILSFLNKNDQLRGEYGDWRSLPAEYNSVDRPPLWQPTPNVPIYVESKTAKLLQDLQDEVVAIKKASVLKKENLSPKRPSTIK